MEQIYINKLNNYYDLIIENKKKELETLIDIKNKSIMNIVSTDDLLGECIKIDYPTMVKYIRIDEVNFIVNNTDKHEISMEVSGYGVSHSYTSSHVMILDFNRKHIGKESEIIYKSLADSEPLNFTFISMNTFNDIVESYK